MELLENVDSYGTSHVDSHVAGDDSSESVQAQ